MKKIMMAMIALTVISGAAFATGNKKANKAETKKECKTSCEKKECSKCSKSCCKPAVKA